MLTSQTQELKKTAQRMRLLQAEMSREFACYLGSSLSVTDIMTVLYFSTMNVAADRADKLEQVG